VNGKDIIKKLKALGWEIRSINGSHHQMIKDGVKVTVPVHGTQMLKSRPCCPSRSKRG